MLTIKQLDSGCGSVGRAVTSDIKDPWFQSSHQQNFIINLITDNY